MGIYEKATEFAGLAVVEYHPEVELVLPTMPRREFILGDDWDSWEITLERDRLATTSGNDGRKRTRKFRTPEAAREEYARLIVEKTREHWIEKKGTGTTTREALAEAVAADPDDTASRNAYLDYLSEQGEQLAVAYRVDGDRYGEEGFGTFRRLESFLAEPALGLVQALVIGSCWARADSMQTSAEVVRALIAARKRLRNLRALFLGDILREESEISWIKQSDLTGLLAAFPDLEHFRARGGDGLVLRKFRHDKLKSLTLEASNLSRNVVRVIGRCELPALEHLELWLGDVDYGADTKVADLKGVLQAKCLPSLKYLGLRNSQIVDGIARALARAPVMERIRELDLSLGILTDVGAEALLAVPGLWRLEKLDIHHHFVSPALVERLQALGIEVDASDAREAEDVGDEELFRFVAHSE
jgi:uncharacterized protein (TIGR02996 family)